MSTQEMLKKCSPDDRQGRRVGFTPVIKGQLAAEQLVGHDPGSPDVRAGIHLTAHHLRGHEPAPWDKTSHHSSIMTGTVLLGLNINLCA